MIPLNAALNVFSGSREVFTGGCLDQGHVCRAENIAGLVDPVSNLGFFQPVQKLPHRFDVPNADKVIDTFGLRGYPVDLLDDPRIVGPLRVRVS